MRFNRTFLPAMMACDAVKLFAEKRLYVISDREHFKVGISQDPDARLTQLQTGHPRQLGRTFGIKLHTGTDYRKLEANIHKDLREFRSDGGREWFKVYDAARLALQKSLERHLRKLGLFTPDIACLNITF